MTQSNWDRTEDFAEAAKALEKLGVEYRRQADGSILVPGSIDITKRGLAELPNLTGVVVMGSFNCNDNNLTSLKGAPAMVDSFFCSANLLTSLEYAPLVVKDSFYCAHNPYLETLKGAPFRCRAFWCHGNPLLTSLEHAPETSGTLQSDLGAYRTLSEAPEHIRKSKETLARELEEDIKRNLVLGRAMRVSKPLSFRK
ncbi:MAG: hypothetical protein EPN97_05800 [Alphaproteobacteria bacterium]|nr:MAG: hypothetical protein EPN97_05800 [Alphaproteobacteria bacterium]